MKLKADGVSRRVRTTARTVGVFLGQQGLPVGKLLPLGKLDRVSPSLDSPLGQGMMVKIIRVTQRMIEKPVTLPFKTTVEFSQSLRPGVQRVIQEGREGSSICLYRLWMADGKVERKDLIDTRRVQKPINRVVAMGDRSFGPSRGGLGVRKVMWMEATGYSPDPRSCGKYATGITSIGLHAGYGVVAVDPKVIPLGSRLYIEGYGYAVAADVGGAIKGLRIDLGHDTHRTALAVGRHQVKVHVLD
ncbi:MAG: G5 domain-containing protein [Armatimonadetes bacterium]|nr:G5 domain-containing protein [Armatimonadota bacterium]